jgi:polar amino acid transport system permease protein
MARRLKPRQRRRLVRGVQYGIGLAVVLVVALTANWHEVQVGFFDLHVARGMLPDVIVPAAVNTLLFTAGAFAFGLVLGTVLALMRLSAVGVYRWVATGYVELFRGLPVLVVLFAVGFGIPQAFPARWRSGWG